MNLRVWTAALALSAGAPAAALTIVPVYDASLTGLAAAPAIEAAFNAVAADYDHAFGSRATVYVGVGWGEVGGTPLPAADVGASESNLYGASSYGHVRALLARVAAGNPADRTLAQALAHLPGRAPPGSGSYVVTSAEAKALGIINPAATGDDGHIGFAGSPAGWSFNPAAVGAGQYDFEAVAAHELSEVLGRISGVDQGVWRTPFDLFRYSAPGALSYSFAAHTYFSIDGGATALEQFNAAATGDRGDWATTTGTRDSFDAFIGRGQHKAVSAVDLAVLDSIGWSGTNAGAGGGKPGGIAFNTAASVPEPAAWTLMIGGFGLIGAAARRRRTRLA